MTARILIMAGGTGGHVFPALAVADALRAAGAEVHWLGTRRGLEARLVPAAGIPLATLAVTGLRGKGAGAWLLAPLRLGWALLQALAVILRFRPMAVLGMGGFAAGPGGLMAWLLRLPLLIHEQNAVPGTTNRLLSRLADRVMVGFPEAFAGRRGVVVTGNPVRAAIAALPPPATRLAGREGPLRLLVIGGSQGARALNEALPAAVAALPAALRPRLHHQTGARAEAAVRAAYAKAGVTQARVEAFVEDMAGAYAWADLVICRAGALTLAELTAAGCAAVLVPFPHAVDDHQTRNARHLEAAGAALLVAEDEALAARLAAILREFATSAEDAAGEPAGNPVSDAQETVPGETASGETVSGAEPDRRRLLAMAQAAHGLARPDAAEAVARLCLEAAHG